MIQGIEYDDWIFRPALDQVFDALILLDLSFDALVLPRHLGQFQRRLEEHPNIGSGNLDSWAADMMRLAQTTNVYCKFSGLLTDAVDTPTKAAISPMAAHLSESENRQIFGKTAAEFYKVSK